MMTRNKFHTEDHEILGATARTSVPRGTGAQNLSTRVYPTEMCSQIFPLFEEIYAPQDFPFTTYLALLVSLPIQKFFRPLR